MKVIALISGGKDSCYNMMQCVDMGHSIVGLANLQPVGKDELDSYMYQTVGHEAIEYYAEAMDLPLYMREIAGASKSTNLNYDQVDGDEVEDLYLLLKHIQSELEYEAVSCGAILSDYQRLRVENVCGRLGLTCLAYLWRREQSELLEEMIQNKVTSILIKTAGMGLEPKHLGLSLHEMKSQLFKLNSKYGSHICGEGGEYESFTLDCPLFKKKIVLDKSEVITVSDDAMAPVTYLKLHKLHLEDKPTQQVDIITTPVLNKTINQLVGNNHVKVKPQLKLKWKQNNNHNNNKNNTTISMKKHEDYLVVGGIYGMLCDEKSVDSIKSATIKAMDVLAGTLQQHGHSLKDATYIHLYIADMSDFHVINSVYKKYFKREPPSRVCVAVWLGKNALLQMDCLSHHNEKQTRNNLHVQSVSHWAPANIGPYSQCVTRGNVHYIAGQIGLVPGSMKLVEGCYEQAYLAMKHVKSILKVMKPPSTLRNTIQCVCYITVDTFVNVARKCWDEQCVEYEEIGNLPIYVVVPHLPKNSSIEWQVISSNKDHINDDGMELTTITSTSYADTKNICSDDGITQSLRNNFQVLKSKIKDQKLSLNNLLQIRLFHAVDDLPINIDFYNQLWGEEEVPSFVLVPVETIFTHVHDDRQIIFQMLCLINQNVI
uniref:diphthine--ammonia ligase isoform X1 n=1 Tax=Ciona intestinalis TaxID=7719 RepID=UPI000180CD7E|nr:diphthine--ammonia ligase isoform X1 [Ciona intestinalis]XP_026690168.1 diphthine--ammonia ligase isoform X2 [Ciona intestinalis]|eukprot:XP_009858382.1 diphthine--ammonia ligase isoform X1 [Ciona intestinalis]